MREDDRPGQGPQTDLAERVRTALLECARAAHRDAGVRGLCAEGAWEAALGAMAQLDLEVVCRARS